MEPLVAHTHDEGTVILHELAIRKFFADRPLRKLPYAPSCRTWAISPPLKSLVRDATLRPSALASSKRTSGQPQLLAHQMHGVLLIFVTDVFQNLAVGQQVHGVLYCEGLGVSFRVVDGLLDLQASKVHAPEPFRDT